MNCNEGQPQIQENPMPQENEAYFEKYPINIDTLDIGYVVRVGCKSFAFETKELMIEKLLAYLNDTANKQRQFFNTGKI